MIEVSFQQLLYQLLISIMMYKY